MTAVVASLSHPLAFVPRWTTIWGTMDKEEEIEREQEPYFT
jgi:hypothetical protein